MSLCTYHKTNTHIKMEVGTPGAKRKKKAEKGQQLSLFLVQNKTFLSALLQFPLEAYRATTGQERSKSETK